MAGRSHFDKNCKKIEGYLKEAAEAGGLGEWMDYVYEAFELIRASGNQNCSNEPPSIVMVNSNLRGDYKNSNWRKRSDPRLYVRALEYLAVSGPLVRLAGKCLERYLIVSDSESLSRFEKKSDGIGKLLDEAADADNVGDWIEGVSKAIDIIGSCKSSKGETPEPNAVVKLNRYLGKHVGDLERGKGNGDTAAYVRALMKLIKYAKNTGFLGFGKSRLNKLVPSAMDCLDRCALIQGRVWKEVSDQRRLFNRFCKFLDKFDDKKENVSDCWNSLSCHISGILAWIYGLDKDDSSFSKYRGKFSRGKIKDKGFLEDGYWLDIFNYHYSKQNVFSRPGVKYWKSFEAVLDKIEEVKLLEWCQSEETLKAVGLKK